MKTTRRNRSGRRGPTSQRRPKPDPPPTTASQRSSANPNEEADEFYTSLFARQTGLPLALRTPDDEKVRSGLKLIADGVLDFVRSRGLPIEAAEVLRPERVVVTALPQATVQAVTVWIDPVHAIAVNQGLMLFMYRVARALSPHIITRGEGDPPAPPESEAISIIASMIDFMSSVVRAPLVPDWPTGPREIRTAENIATAGERFVLSHEIAHITLRHLIADAHHVDRTKAAPQDFNDRPLAQEIEADTFGAVISIESQPDPRPGAVGVAMFLHSLRLAESVGAIVPDGKHPSAVDRLDTLWTTVLPHRYGTQARVVTSWADEISVLLTRIGDAALRERQVRRQKAREDLSTIFREHPSLIVARDYEADRRMIANVRSLYDAAPGAVIEAVAENLLGEPQLSGALGSANDDRFKRHRLAMFIAHSCMAPPVRAAVGLFGLSGGRQA